MPTPRRAPIFSTTNLVFILSTFVVILVTHAIAYLTHEYSHSLAAWALGWMDRPFGIDYGSATLDNVLFLNSVDDNVTYSRIFDAGHGAEASVVALSGPFIGNGLLYFILYGIARARAVQKSAAFTTFIYWLSLMCAANVWSYVPLRAITTHADIFLAAQGLGISTLALFPFLMIPAAYIVFHFFRKLLPLCEPVITAGERGKSIVVAVLTAYWFFSFFSGASADGKYGLTSEIIGVISKYLLVPVCTLWLLSRSHEPADCVSEPSARHAARAP